MSIFSKKKYINCRKKLIDFSEPKIMGILNLTPDSFYDGGKYYSENLIVSQIDKMVQENVDMIDVGAFSSKPYSDFVSIEEERDRLDFGLRIIRKKYSDLILSVDTFRSEIAEFAVKNYEVDIINDISSGDFDDRMFETIAKLNVPYIIVHIKGNPQTMQINPKYENIVNDILKFFSQKIEKIKILGVKDIIIDPGFGFGKTMEHNYEILNNLDDFKVFEYPLLVGISRKSMIYKLLKTTPDNALNGTIVLNTVSLLKGANILRVHDVKEAKEVISIIKQIHD